MSQQHKQETLSALFDGELSEFELRRLLKEIDAEDLQQWRRYQLLRDCCAKSQTLPHYQLDVSAQVAAQIAQESSVRKTWYKPVMGFASAAMFAFVAVLGVQEWQQQHDVPAGFVAEGNVSASQLSISSSPGLSTASAKSVAILPNDQAALVDGAKKSEEVEEAAKQAKE